MTLESNGLSSDLLRLGAEQAAAGQTLGLSPEETFNLQQHLRERGIKEVRADEYAPDPFGEAPEQAFDDRGLKVGDVRRPQDDFRPADSPPKVGRAKEAEVMNMGPGKPVNRGVPEGQAVKNPLIRAEKVRAGVLPEEFLNANEVAEGLQGRKRGFLDAENLGGPAGDREVRVNPGAGAPGRGVADALAQLKRGREKFGTAPFPGMGEAIERLEEDNQPGKIGLQNERKLAAALVAADARPFNTGEIDNIVAAELYNRFGGEEYVRADGKRINKAAAARIAADQGRERQLGQFDIPVDQLAAAEAEIRAGLEGRGGQDPLMQLVNQDAAIRRAERQGKYGDQRGQRILDEMDEIKNIGFVKDLGPKGEVEFVKPVNTPDSAQAVNAPQGPLPRQQRWMIDNLPDYQGKDVQYPQVGILEEGKLFADRLRGMGANVPRAEVRNIDELQQAADFVIRQAAAKGKRLGKYDREAGKMAFTDNPGISEVLYKLRYADGEVQRLANAMNQIEMQRIAGGPNSARAEMFAERVPGGIGKGVQVYGNNPNMRPDGGIPLALIKNEKVGQGDKKLGVRAELANLGPEGVLRQLEEAGQLYTQDAQGQKILLPEAANIIAGADAARDDAQMAIQGGLKGEVPRANFIRGDVRQMGRPERVRRMGKENADNAGRVEANFLAGEESRRRREAGQQIVEIRPQRGGQGSDFATANVTKVSVPPVRAMSPKQPIQEAQVAPSIAPDPWASTGPARSSQQGDFKGGFANAMMQKELQNRAGRERFRNRAGVEAAAAAGVAGLAALIGGERDQREQEQY